jgi:hypothetical protein
MKVLNYLDLFQTCVMHEVDFLIIGITIDYGGNLDILNVITFY